jgi:hypothetical protein
MGRSPDEIREDIARTRDAASQSAAALSEQLRPDRRAAEVAEGVVDGARREPGVAAAALAVGFLLGRMTKRRRRAA